MRNGVTIMSKKYTLNKADIEAFLVNAIIFIAPDLIVFLVALSAKFSAEGAIVMVLVLNLAIDLIRKFIAGKK
jgi:hypothetical protein